MKYLESILFYKRRGLIQGFFGGGKTYSTIKLVKREIRRSRHNILVIYASPLRKLRDFVSTRWLNDLDPENEVFVFRAHDEVCDDLKERLQGYSLEENKFFDGGTATAQYYRALAEHLQSGKCVYREQISNLKFFIQTLEQSRIIVTTHELALVAIMLAHIYGRQYVALFDECEDYLEKISNPLPKHVVESFKDIDPVVYRRLKTIYTEIENMYWTRITTLESMLNNIIISATLPRTLHEYLLFTKKEVPRYIIYTRKARDRVYILNEVIPALKSVNSKILFSITKLVEYGIENYGAVGIIAKNKDHERALIAHLASLGYRVSSEVTHDLPSQDADVYVLTPGGKWYRGVSIYNRRTGRDIPFIIAFYQGGKSTRIHPVLQQILSMIVSEKVVHGDADAFFMYSLELNYAKNLQSLYRYNRQRDREHVMVLLDSRWVYAYRYYHRRKWEEMKRTTFYSIDDLVDSITKS